MARTVLFKRNSGRKSSTSQSSTQSVTQRKVQTSRQVQTPATPQKRRPVQQQAPAGINPSTTVSRQHTKSFFGKIADARGASTLSSFSAFPERVQFEGQDAGEKIVLLIRQDPAVLIPKILLILGLLLVPFLAVLFVITSGTEIGAGDVAFGMGVTVVWAMFIITLIAGTFFKWFFTVNIVTSERIFDIDFLSHANHKVAECQLEKVEDVSHAPVGMWATLFDYGTVFVQTAGEQREFEFDNVPRPRDVQDTILDLLELKQTRTK